MFSMMFIDILEFFIEEQGRDVGYGSGVSYIKRIIEVFIQYQARKDSLRKSVIFHPQSDEEYRNNSNNIDDGGNCSNVFSKNLNRQCKLFVLLGSF